MIRYRGTAQWHKFGRTRPGTSRSQLRLLTVLALRDAHGTLSTYAQQPIQSRTVTMPSTLGQSPTQAPSPVRGWLAIELEDASLRLIAHSVVRNPDGTLIDPTYAHGEPA